MATDSVVIKIGGRVQSDPQLPWLVAARWLAYRRAHSSQRDDSGAMCVVHGGGDEVSALQRAAGVEPTFIGGKRVTQPDDIDRLRMALSGVANKRLVAALRAAGAHAVGLSGEDGPLLRADPVANRELGAVGEVREVDTNLLTTLVGAGYLPVVAPLAAPRVTTSSPAAALNINGDDAATAVAGALGARELLFISDVPGVRVGGQTVSHLTRRECEDGIASRDIAGGMEAKVTAAMGALDRGVARVRIGSLSMLADAAAGTLIAEEHAVVGSSPVGCGSAAS
jgi:acetylglutamate kinase